MSRVVDERVVEMTFDNKNFESNMKTSMSTLERFKNSLKFSGVTNSINESLNSVNVNPLLSSIDKTEKAFGSLADYIEFSVVNRLTNKIIDLGEKITKSLSVDQISAGWQKFESEAKSSGTLSNIYEDLDFSDIQAQMDKLKWYSDATSYSYTTMMETLQQFASTGMDIDKATTSIMGIAQWAGQAGVGANEASLAMQRLSQAMMQGTITWQQWESINLKGMNTEAFRKQIMNTAKELGTVTESAGKYYVAGTNKLIASFDETTQKWDWSGFKDTLSDKWFTSDVLADTLSKYASSINDIYDLATTDGNGINTTSEAIEEFNKKLAENTLGLSEEDLAMQKMSSSAMEAASECRTLTDAINAAKDAVATGWMNIYGQIFGNYSEAKKVWNKVYGDVIDPIFVQSLKGFSSIFEQWNKLGGRMTLFNDDIEKGPIGAIWNLTDAFMNLISIVKEAWNNVFPFFKEFDGNKLLSFTKSLQESTANLKITGDTAEKLSNILQGFFSVIKLVCKAISALWSAAKPLIAVAKSIASTFVSMLSTIGKVITNFVEYFDGFAKLANSISAALVDLIKWFNKLSIVVKIKELLHKFNNELQSGITLSENTKKILIGLESFITVIGKLIKSIILLIQKTLGPAISWLSDALVTLFSFVGPKLIKFLTKISEKITNFANSLNDSSIFQNATQKLVDWFRNIPRLLKPVGDFLAAFFSKIKKAFKSFADFLTGKSGKSIGDIFNSIWTSIAKAVKKIGNAISSIGRVNTKPVEDFTNDINEKTTPLQALLTGIRSFANGALQLIKAIIPIIGKILTKIGDLLRSFAKSINSAFNNGENNGFNLFSLLKKGLIVALILKIALTIYNMAYAIQALKKPLSILTSSIQDLIDAKTAMMYSEAFQTMTKSLMYVVAALVVLSLIDTKKLKVAAIALGVLIGILGAVFIGITKISEMVAYGNKTVARASKNITLFKARITKILDELMTSLSQSIRIKVIGSTVKAMAVSLAILVGSLVVLNKMDHSKIWDSMIVLEAILISMMAVLVAIAKLSKYAKNSTRALKTIVGFAVSVGSLVPAINSIGDMNIPSLFKAVTVISVLGLLMTVMAKMIGTSKNSLTMIGDKTYSNTIKVSMLNFIAFSAGIILFAQAIKTLVKSVNAVTSVNIGLIIGFSATLLVLMRGLRKSFKAVSKTDIQAASSFVAVLYSLTKSISTIASTLKVISSVGSPGQIILATGVMLTIVAALAGVIVESNKYNIQKGSLTFAASCLLVAMSIVNVATAMKILSTIDTKSLLVGTASIAGLMAIFGQVTKNLVSGMSNKQAANVAIIASSLMILSVALTMLTVPISILGHMKWGTIAKGFGVLASLVVILSFITKMLATGMSNKQAANVAIIASSLMILSVALTMLTVPISILGHMKWGTIAKGLGTLLVALIAIGVGFALLSNIAEEILTLAISFGIISAAAFLTAKSFEIISNNLVSFGENLGNFANSVAEHASEIINAFTILGIALGKAITNMLVALGKSGNEITNALFNLLISSINALLNGLDELVSTLLTVIIKILDAICEHIYDIVDVILKIIIEVLRAINDNIYDIIVELWKVLVNIFNAICDSIIKDVGQICVKLVDLICAILDGLGKALVSGTSKLRTALDSFSKSLLTAFNTLLFGENWSNFINQAWDKFKDWGKYILDGFVNGLQEAWHNVTDWFQSAGNWISDTWCNMFGIHSPSRKFASYGSYMMQGLKNGLNDGSNSVYNTVDDIGDNINNTMNNTISKVADAINSGVDNDLVITPVLDLSEIQNGTSKLSDMMNSVNGYEISGSAEYAVRAQRDTNRRYNNSDASGTTNNNTTNNDNSSYVNNIYITGDNPKDIADKVAEELQKKLKRGKAAWGQS